MGTFINSPKCLLHHANIPNLTKSRTPYPPQAEFDADMQRAFSQRMAECLMDNLVDLRYTRDIGRKENYQTQRMLLG